MIKSTNQFKADKFKEVTVTDGFKTKQTWRRATPLNWNDNSYDKGQCLGEDKFRGLKYSLFAGMYTKISTQQFSRCIFTNLILNFQAVSVV
jgi:hypothetical protein